MKASLHALSDNMKSRNTVSGSNEGDFEKEKIIVEPYIPADPGPYPQDQPKQNSVRFTPTQVPIGFLFVLKHPLSGHFFSVIPSC